MRTSKIARLILLSLTLASCQSVKPDGGDPFDSLGGSSTGASSGTDSGSGETATPPDDESSGSNEAPPDSDSTTGEGENEPEELELLVIMNIDEGRFKLVSVVTEPELKIEVLEEEVVASDCGPPNPTYRCAFQLPPGEYVVQFLEAPPYASTPQSKWVPLTEDRRVIGNYL